MTSAKNNQGNEDEEIERAAETMTEHGDTLKIKTEEDSKADEDGDESGLATNTTPNPPSGTKQKKKKTSKSKRPKKAKTPRADEEHEEDEPDSESTPSRLRGPRTEIAVVNDARRVGWPASWRPPTSLRTSHIPPPFMREESQMPLLRARLRWSRGSLYTEVKRMHGNGGEDMGFKMASSHEMASSHVFCTSHESMGLVLSRLLLFAIMKPASFSSAASGSWWPLLTR